MTLDTSGLVKKVTKGRWRTEYFENVRGNIVAKKCSMCGEIKELGGFYNSKNSLAGRLAKCIECTSVANSEYYLNNRDKVLDYKAEYRRNNLDKILIRDLEYYRNNRDRYAEYRRNNREKYAEYMAEYQRNNPHIIRLASARRRARTRNLPDNLTQEQKAKILNNFGGACAISGDEGDGHIDHVIPVSVGHGGTIYENMIPLRADLNQSKSDRNIFEWFADNRERFDLSQRKFDELIEYLADINEMTVEEYRDYVYWCHDNPRTVDEIIEERAKA